jgi:hypothetical protein
MMVAHPIAVNEESVSRVVGMVLVAVICLWGGMKMPFDISLPQHLPYIEPSEKNLTYVRVVLLAGAVATFFPTSIYMFGGGPRQVLLILESIVPIVAFVFLLQRYLAGTAVWADRMVLLIYLCARVLGSLSSGWIGPLAGLGVTIVGVFISQQRRIPWRYVVLTVGAVLFLQVGKTAYRSKFWSQDSDSSVIERAGFWISASASQWLNPANDSENRGQLASETMERSSLLVQTAHVLDMTPSVVPFQEGSTYSYMAVTLIPRFLWPEKPSMSDANRFYQIAYGLSDQRGLDYTSISSGCLAESYINFGWFGVVGIMFLIGMILGVYERATFVARSNSYFLAIGLTLLPGFLTIDSQLAQYMSGVVQQLVLMLLAFLPILKTQRRSLQVVREPVPQFRVRNSPVREQR